MGKPTFTKKRIEKLIQKIFPKSNIKTHEKFIEGLVSQTFKVKIIHPTKILVIKLSKLKNKNRVHQNNKILKYLGENKIPVLKIYLEQIYDKKYLTIMEHLKGDVASNIYRKSPLKTKKNLLLSSGEILYRIHNLEPASFWVHHKHEIKNIVQWKKWTKQRIKKYLEFSKKNLPEYQDFLETELKKFYRLLKNESIGIVPLHWDYHLSNLNANKNGLIEGVFDFDNAMKGHSLADIGQTAYWIRFHTKDYKNFKYFLKGYKNKFSKKELILIRGYFLLHLLAVTRTIWNKKKRLGWIIDDHKTILNEFTQNKI